MLDTKDLKIIIFVFFLMILGIIALGIIIIIGALISAKKEKKKLEKVRQNSILLKNLELLKNKYVFFQIEDRVIRRKSRSKKHTSLDVFKNDLIEHRGFYESLICKVEQNRRQFSAYFIEYSKLKSFATPELASRIKMPFEKFKKIEEREFKKKSLVESDMYTDVKIKVMYEYPKSLNWDYDCYNFDDVKRLLNIAIEEEKRRDKERERIKKERMKMTDSLRYDVLMRDGYRCKICGATAADGIKLHVDHICPVSKGGKTEMDNLQTLCERCNLGKSNKY